MKTLEAVSYDALMSRFTRGHSYDPCDEADSNDEAAAHIHDAQHVLGGRWHRVLLEGPEVLDVVLPWHLGEDGDVELIPPTGLTVAAAAIRLAALDATYTQTNPLCAFKLTRQNPRPGPAAVPEHPGDAHPGLRRADRPERPGPSRQPAPDAGLAPQRPAGPGPVSLEVSVCRASRVRSRAWSWA